MNCYIKLLTRVRSSMLYIFNCMGMLKLCKKLPPNTNVSVGVYTAWIQPERKGNGGRSWKHALQYGFLRITVQGSYFPLFSLTLVLNGRSSDFIFQNLNFLCKTRINYTSYGCWWALNEKIHLRNFFFGDRIFCYADQTDLKLVHLSNPSTVVSQVARTAGTYHHVQCKKRVCCVCCAGNQTQGFAHARQTILILSYIFSSKNLINGGTGTPTVNQLCRRQFIILSFTLLF